jgi:hypothetical protein
VDRSLADSKVEAVSTDLRFIAAFNAALCVATTGLRASGLRAVTQAGHHVKTIESLELTAQRSLRRLGPVPLEFDALFAAARTWDTLTSVSLPLP